VYASTKPNSWLRAYNFRVIRSRVNQLTGFLFNAGASAFGGLFASAAPLCHTFSMSLVKELLRPLAEDGAALTREQASSVLEEILGGNVPDVETAALLTVMATRGEQAPELAGFVDVMRRNSVALPFEPDERDSLVDCVGTGGGGPQTFNISCGAALVAAAAGAHVAKHGNRAVTSRCGAADVLEALGVPIELGPELAVACQRETGFVFLFAPLYHPAMKALGPLRRALGFRTIFNLVGPLTNPAQARAQVIGVLAPSRVLLVGRTLVMLGARRAFVVHGTDGIDELTTTGESIVARIEESESSAGEIQPSDKGPSPGPPTLKAARVTPEMAGLPRAALDQFTGGDVATNKALLYDVITGTAGARRDVVLLNAAAVLVAAGLAGDLKEGVAMGAEAIDSGQAAATLAKLQQFGEKYAAKQ
jgi:anthranilate phosphoribosyltransferase